MTNTYQIYLISDSTGETLDRIFLALKAQFLNIKYNVHSYSFTRTENQILKILDDAEKNNNSIILYTIVDNNLAKYLANKSDEKRIPCFGVSVITDLGVPGKIVEVTHEDVQKVAAKAEVILTGLVKKFFQSI